MDRIVAMALAFLLVLPFAGINGGEVASTIDTNDILYVGGSGPGNYTRVQAALDDAGDGATVYVYPGLYHESIVINKQLGLIGIEKNGEKPVIQAEENHSAVLILADGCTLKGFIMKSQEILISDDNPPSCEIRSDSNIIENNTFMYGTQVFFLNQSSYNVIKHNTIIGGYWRGMYSRYGTHNDISGNEARLSSGEGFYLREANSTITYNTATENCHGMSISGSSSCSISFNSIYRNTQYGLSLDDCTDVSVINNSIHDHAYGGVLVSDSSNCTISGNELYSNQAGVRLYGTIGVNYEGSTHNVVARNDIYGNDVGIYWESGCKNNYFTYNNLVDNSENAYFWTSLEIGDPDFPLHRPCQNIWNRNYWSDWTTSVPKPIQGMLTVWLSSFYIDLPWLTFDKHPAAEPHGNITLPDIEDDSTATTFPRGDMSLPSSLAPVSASRASSSFCDNSGE